MTIFESDALLAAIDRERTRTAHASPTERVGASCFGNLLGGGSGVSSTGVPKVNFPTSFQPTPALQMAQAMQQGGAKIGQPNGVVSFPGAPPNGGLKIPQTAPVAGQGQPQQQSGNPWLQQVMFGALA